MKADPQARPPIVVAEFVRIRTRWNCAFRSLATSATGNSRREPASRSRRSGLSLIEVLIALALSGLLLSSIYSAINMYFHFSTSGQEDVEKNQLARVLMLRIEQDLRSIVYSPEDSSAAETDDETPASGSTTAGGSTSGTTGGTTTGGSSTDTSSTSTKEKEATDPSDAFAGSASGLFGDMQTVVLHVSRPRQDLLSAPQLNNQNAVSRTSDLKTVSYFVAGNGSGGLQAAAAAHFASQNRSGNSKGLARMEGDRLALQLADKSGNTAAVLGQTQMLAPEVSRVGFRYYDGTNWVIQWDSAKSGGLPRAVEVSLEISDASVDPNQSRFKKARKVSPPRTYKSVIPLPLSKPIMSSGV